MKKRVSLEVVLAFLVALVLLVGCGGEEPTEVPQVSETATEIPPTEAPPEPIQLVVARDFDLNTMDPHRAFEDTALIVLKAMYDQLTAVDPNDSSQVIPHLAESWTINDDGTVYIFKLRSGVKFSSGNEMTADDVKFSLDRIKNLQGNPAFFQDGVASVEVVDPLTVRVTLEKPAADFLSRLSGIYVAIIDSKVAMEHGATSGPDAQDTDQAQAWLDENSAGSGPFVLERWLRDQELRLVANPDYWAGPPHVDSVLMRDMKDITTQKQLLEQGDIDIAMNIDPDAAKELGSAPGVEIRQGRSYSQVYMGLTGSEEVNPIIATNQALRQAIGFAIDYDGLNNQVLAGNAEQPPSIVPLGFLATDVVEPIHRDLDKANQLMAEAGYADGIDLEMYYPNATYYGVDFAVVAQKLQSDMAEIGINVTLVPQEPAVFMPAYRATELPWVISYWVPDWFDPSAQIDSFATPASLVAKRLGYVNEENAELSAQALATTDRQERIDLYAQIQRNMQEDAHLFGMIQPRVVLAYRDNIENYTYHPVVVLDLYAIEKN